MSDNLDNLPVEPERSPEDVQPLSPGPAEAEEKCGRGISTVGKLGAAVVIGGAVFLCSGIVSSPCMGATRSSQLEWQRRDAEIQTAWEQDQTPPVEKPSPTPCSGN